MRSWLGRLSPIGKIKNRRACSRTAMKLVSFSVSNYRSIISAKRIPISDYSVLAGANNEGKSNILHALALAMAALENYKYSIRRDALGRIIRTRNTILGSSYDYVWRRDYPISKQFSKSKTKDTEVILEFQLSDKENEEFKEEVGNKLNQILPISVIFSESELKVSVVKQGPGKEALTKNANRIAEFVSKRVQFEYIPAIRTSENAQKVIYELLEKELSRLYDDPDYVAALQKVEELQKPILDELAATVRTTVSAFLPSVKNVEISSPRGRRTQALSRSIGIEIDDGNKTSLDRKGDGVKSLVALAMMRHASETKDANCANIVAIEEPEAHLHPYAIHELRDVLVALSKSRQVVLTTHSPQFIRPNHVQSTIIVEGSAARPAKSISEVRETLGVRLSDNLQSARLVLIVEGITDVTSLSAILQERDEELRTAIKSGDLIFDHLRGAGKLTYKIATHRAALSMVHVFLDGDAAGKERVKVALSEKALTDADYNLTHHVKKNVSEIEDLFEVESYATDFFNKFGVDLRAPVVDPHKKTWSDTVKARFEASGKLFDKEKENEVKFWLAEFVKSNPKKVLGGNAVAPIDALIASLKLKLTS